MRIELTRVGLLGYLANHYTTQGALTPLGGDTVGIFLLSWGGWGDLTPLGDDTVGIFFLEGWGGSYPLRRRYTWHILFFLEDGGSYPLRKRYSWHIPSFLGMGDLTPLKVIQLAYSFGGGVLPPSRGDTVGIF